jgi:hypothetical protein
MLTPEEGITMRFHMESLYRYWTPKLSKAVTSAKSGTDLWTDHDTWVYTRLISKMAEDVGVYGNTGMSEGPAWIRET